MLFPLLAVAALFWWARRKPVALKPKTPNVHPWGFLTYPSLTEGKHYFFAIKLLGKPDPTNFKTVIASMFPNLYMVMPGHAISGSPPNPQPDDWHTYLDKGYAIGYGQWQHMAGAKIDPLVVQPVGADTSVPVVYWKATEDYVTDAMGAVK